MTDFQTLERIYPEQVDTTDRLERESLELHLERYRFAAAQLRGARVLDIACGAGYGTALLAEASPRGLSGDTANPPARQFVGVDIDADAIAYARKQYERPDVQYVATDAMTFRSDAPFDTVVSLETIEHLPDPEGFLDNLLGLVTPGATIIASVPTTPSVDANPNHVHDFTERSFARMFEARGFTRGPVFRQVQPFSPRGVAKSHGHGRLHNVRPNLPRYYLTHPAAVAKRVWSTLRFGFTNRYLTAIWRRG
jgi:2-polyprenyl-3-methyl-5-hydroxy-6-metoxy-1,4-benzoquinol methylase